MLTEHRENVHHLETLWIFVSLCKPDWKGGASQPHGKSEGGVSSEWTTSGPGLTASWLTCSWASHLASNMVQGQTPADVATTNAHSPLGAGVAGQPAWRWEGASLCVILQLVGPSSVPLGSRSKYMALLVSAAVLYFPEHAPDLQSLWIRIVRHQPFCCPPISFPLYLRHPVA